MYFSCSGGHTESIQYGWPGASSIPYLKGVDDPYDTYATLHDWGPLRRTAAEIAKPLGVGGTLRAVYTVKRGTSPRIVKAALVSSAGVKFMDGNELRMKLGLKSTWADVHQHVHLPGGARPRHDRRPTQSLTLKGRIYPALGAGESLRLYFNDGDAWRSREVTTTVETEKLGSGYIGQVLVVQRGHQPGADDAVLLQGRQERVADHDDHRPVARPAAGTPRTRAGFAARVRGESRRRTTHDSPRVSEQGSIRLPSVRAQLAIALRRRATVARRTAFGCSDEREVTTWSSTSCVTDRLRPAPSGAATAA